MHDDDDDDDSTKYFGWVAESYDDEVAALFTIGRT